MTPLILLPAPERPYRDLVRDLEAMGWVWAGEPQRLPLIRGEPEQVDWRHPAGGRMRYRFNPAVRLRQISAEGPPAALAPLSLLPRLDEAGISRLLGEADTESVLRGVLAARAVGADRFVDALGGLRRHGDPLIRAAADETLAELSEGAEHRRRRPRSSVPTR